MQLTLCNLQSPVIQNSHTGSNNFWLTYKQWHSLQLWHTPLS